MPVIVRPLPICAMPESLDALHEALPTRKSSRQWRKGESGFTIVVPEPFANETVFPSANQSDFLNTPSVNNNRCERPADLYHSRGNMSRPERRRVRSTPKWKTLVCLHQGLGVDAICESGSQQHIVEIAGRQTRHGYMLAKDQKRASRVSLVARYSRSESDVVKAGAPLAKIGNTGASMGPHLHFSISDKPDFFVGRSLPFVFDSLPW